MDHIEYFIKRIARKWHKENNCWPKSVGKGHILIDKLYDYWSDEYNNDEKFLVSNNRELTYYKGTDLYLVRNKIYHLFMAYSE